MQALVTDHQEKQADSGGAMPLPVRQPWAPYDPLYYVTRYVPPSPDLEDQIIEDLDERGLVFLVAPSGIGKSYLMGDLVDRLLKQGIPGVVTKRVNLDMKVAIHNAAGNGPRLLDEVADEIADALGVSEKPSGSLRRLPWDRALTIWLEKIVLPGTNKRLILAFDCSGVPPGSAHLGQLYMRLESWQGREGMAREPGKLLVLVAHRLACSERDPLRLVLKSCRRPIPVFTEGQATSLAQLFGQHSAAELAELRSLLGTHPLFWAAAVYLLHHPRKAVPFDEVTRQAREASGMFEEILRDVFNDIDDEHRRALRDIARGSTAVLPKKMEDLLVRMKILEIVDGGYAFCIALVRAYFEKSTQENLLWSQL